MRRGSLVRVQPPPCEAQMVEHLNAEKSFSNSYVPKDKSVKARTLTAKAYTLAQWESVRFSNLKVAGSNPV